ncbi:MAG: hypothetical protein Q4G65_00615 [bacterium]|nr:hypothetical protein [bacterium]
MSKKTKIYALLVVLFCGIAGVVYFSMAPKPAGTGKKSVRQVQGDRRKTVKKTSQNRKREFVTRIKNKEGSFKIEIPKDDEEKLSAAYKALLQALRDAMDPLDKDKIRALVKSMQNSNEWPDGIPSVLHMAAIEALSELGSDGVDQLAGYLASGDPEVREEAMDEIVESVDDETLSDLEKSEMIKAFSRYVRDSDALESLFDIVDNDMRNSVQYDTLVAVLENGTSEAKQKLLAESLPDIIDSEDAFQSIEEAKKALDEWVAENPDDPDDEEDFSGTPKDPDDDDD